MDEFKIKINDKEHQAKLKISDGEYQVFYDEFIYEVSILKKAQIRKMMTTTIEKKMALSMLSR